MRTIEKVTENMTLHTLKIFALNRLNEICYDKRALPVADEAKLIIVIQQGSGAPVRISNALTGRVLIM